MIGIGPQDANNFRRFQFGQAIHPATAGGLFFQGRQQVLPIDVSAVFHVVGSKNDPGHFLKKVILFIGAF